METNRLRRVFAVTITIALVVLGSQLAVAHGAHAQEAHAQADTQTIIAEGLNGPQGVLVGPAGIVWVIETGLGGDESLDVLDTETGELVEASFGTSARIIQIDPGTGEQTVVSSLPSVITPTGGYGGGRLALHHGDLFASVGEWATPGTERPDGLATISAIASDGTVSSVADTWVHEADNDPYGRGSSHSHPFGMATATDGRLLYVDAGANALMAVDTDSGAIETVAVFEPLPGVFPRPDYGGEMLTDPVPTSVVVHNGRTFVSLLSGAPFVPGSAKVVEVGPDGSLSDFATGLTMLTDLRAGPDGNLYATTFAVFGEQGPSPASGAVTRIGSDGSTEVAAQGLSFVTSIDFDADGNAYVAANGVGPPGSGQVVRLDGLASSGAGPIADPLLAETGSDVGVALAVVAFTFIGAGTLFLRSRRHVARII